jgi:glycosyltransferase involved in cell wall biosynthesis
MLNVLRWDSSVFLINNGIFEHEIYSKPSQKSSVPAKWLVLGNPNAGKGWFDFFLALSRLLSLELVKEVETVVLTGLPAGEDLELYNAVCKEFTGTIDIEFISPFEDLGLACKNFDLIISPSRNESFGMAVLEACCSRECVVSSRTGIADKIIFDSRMLFLPGNVDELVESLKYVIEKWPKVLGLRDQDLEHVRGCFNVEQNAESLLKLFHDKQNRLKCND